MKVKIILNNTMNEPYISRLSEIVEFIGLTEIAEAIAPKIFKNRKTIVNVIKVKKTPAKVSNATLFVAFMVILSFVKFLM